MPASSARSLATMRAARARPGRCHCSLARRPGRPGRRTALCSSDTRGGGGSGRLAHGDGGGGARRLCGGAGRHVGGTRRLA
eukprot:125922-Chlamydomonas_euryale.AAC.1